MSTILALTQEASTVLPLADAQAGGILDWVDAKSAQAQTTFRGLSILLSIIFIIWQAVASKMAMARVIISGLAAGVFIWIVWNVTTLQERVGNEVNAADVISTVGHLL